jgi:DNA-binding GntR family transcriptional regulator
MSSQKKDVLVHKVYQDLKNMILNGELKSGDKLYQERIADRLGVSRTPLVKAFQILEQEMFIESIPRRGMYVKAINDFDMLNAFECRQGIETTAVRILTFKISNEQLKELKDYFKPFLNSKSIDRNSYLKADSEFHLRLIQMTGNDFLIRINQIAHVFNQTYMKGLIREPKETLSEHLMILSAMEMKDAGLAEECMRSHIRKTVEKIRKSISDIKNIE